MQNFTRKSRRDFRDFKFRRRHDHFLHYKLLGTKKDEIIVIAAELGFNIDIKDLQDKKRHKNRVSSQRNKRNKSAKLFHIPRLKTLLKNIFKPRKVQH